MTSHATVSAENSKILSQITENDISELTEVIDAVDHSKSLLDAVSSLTMAHTNGSIQELLLSVVQAAHEKLDSINEKLKAWPSAGMVTIAEPQP
jgi:hypothetical protein